MRSSCLVYICIPFKLPNQWTDFYKTLNGYLLPCLASGPFLSGFLTKTFVLRATWPIASSLILSFS
jgi:hypothetical protein